MFRTCKVCGLIKWYEKEGRGAKGKGFNGLVCYACFLEDQRVWRTTELGREQAREDSRKSRLSRKRTKAIVVKDV